MDQELITRFRAGDDEARAAVRNHLRAVAARVLAAPQWKLSEVTTRSALEVQAAVAALESPAQEPVSFAMAAMHAAGVAGLEHLRALDGALGDHPKAEVMVKVALETAIGAQVLHVDRHAEGCAACRAHLDVLRAALTSAATAQRSTAPSRPEPKREKVVQPEPKKKSRPTPRARPKKQPEQGLPLASMAFVAALVVGGVWWGTQLSDEEKAWAAAAHLPDELPPGAMAAHYDGSTRDAILGMAKGDCRGASAKLHMASKRAPDDYDLRYLEGMALVCMRDPMSLDALQDVNDNVHWDDLPWGFEWWYAQALVLNDDIGGALDELDRLAGMDHGRSQDAEALAATLRAAY